MDEDIEIGSVASDDTIDEAGPEDPDAIVQKNSVWSESDLTTRLQTHADISGFKLCVIKTKGNPDRVSNKMPHVHFHCSRRGHARKKKSGPSTRRARNSFKCDCKWSIKAYETTEGLYRITSCTLVHTGGCTPSTQQLAVSVVKSTNKKIPAEVLSAMLALYRVDATVRQFRNFIKLHNLDLPTGAQDIVNLKLTLCRQYTQGNLTDVTTDMLTKHIHHDELSTLFAGVFRTHMENAEKDLVLHTLKACARHFPGFDYRVRFDTDGVLWVVVWQTGHQRASIRLWGQMLWFDGKEGLLAEG